MFPLPQGIPTFVTIPELRLLQRYAETLNVLEIGTQYGYTTIGMALAGAHVTSVDPHDQGPASNPDTWPAFLRNVRHHKMNGRMVAMRSAIESTDLDRLMNGYLEVGWKQWGWGLVFIDGDHAYEAVRRDFEIAAVHLCEPRWVAFHDVTPRWPGVWQATQELEREGRIEKLEQVGVLAVYRAV